MELVRYEPRTLPELVVVLPAARPCEASGCEDPSVADMIYIEIPALHLVQICGFHLFTLRHRVRDLGEGGALFFPLDCAPPLQVVGREWERQMRARQQRSQQFGQFFQFVSMTTSSTGFGTINFNVS